MTIFNDLNLEVKMDQTVISTAMQEMQNWYLENYPDDYREADGSIWKPLLECMGKIEQVRKTLDNPPTHAQMLKTLLQGVALHASRKGRSPSYILHCLSL